MGIKRIAIYGLISYCAVFVMQSCGFQLNRNKIQLPNQADSIAISKIENKSYVPRLDIQLRAQLIETLVASSIVLKQPIQADLVLTFIIKTFNQNRNDYALDDNNQTYEFKFTAAGDLSVFDNRTKSYYLSNYSLNSSYSIVTEATDLTTTEIEEGQQELINSLSKAIAEKLTNSF